MTRAINLIVYLLKKKKKFVNHFNPYFVVYNILIDNFYKPYIIASLHLSTYTYAGKVSAEM